MTRVKRKGRNNISCRNSPIITRFRGVQNRNTSLKTDTETRPQEDKMSGPDQTVRHEIITTAADLPKFSGEPNTISITDYIIRINTHIANKEISSDALKIEIIKQNIDHTKGQARHRLKFKNIENEKVYERFVEAFKNHYTTKSEKEPL